METAVKTNLKFRDLNDEEKEQYQGFNRIANAKVNQYDINFVYNKAEGMLVVAFYDPQTETAYDHGYQFSFTFLTRAFKSISIEILDELVNYRGKLGCDEVKEIAESFEEFSGWHHWML